MYYSGYTKLVVWIGGLELGARPCFLIFLLFYVIVFVKLLIEKKITILNFLPIYYFFLNNINFYTIFIKIYISIAFYFTNNIYI